MIKDELAAKRRPRLIVPWVIGGVAGLAALFAVAAWCPQIEGVSCESMWTRMSNGSDTFSWLYDLFAVIRAPWLLLVLLFAGVTLWIARVVKALMADPRISWIASPYIPGLWGLIWAPGQRILIAIGLCMYTAYWYDRLWHEDRQERRRG